MPFNWDGVDLRSFFSQYQFGISRVWASLAAYTRILPNVEIAMEHPEHQAEIVWSLPDYFTTEKVVLLAFKAPFLQAFSDGFLIIYRLGLCYDFGETRLLGLASGSFLAHAKTS